MEYRKLIDDSWKFAQSHKSIMLIYAFIPAVLNAIFSFGFLTYEVFSIKNSPELTNSTQTFLAKIFYFGKTFISEKPQFVIPIAAIVAVYMLAYTFLPTLSKGAIVQLIARIKNNQTPKVISGVGYGLRSFLPLFGFNAFLNIFSISTILSYLILVLVNFGTEPLRFFLPIFILLFIVGIIMSFLFAFAENFIIIDHKSIDEAIRASASLVVQNWAETMLMLILLGLIALRVLLNMLLIFLIPFGASAAISFFATIKVANLGIVLAGLLFLFAIYIIGYIGGTFTLFANSVWTYAFLELTSDHNLSARDSK